MAPFQKNANCLIKTCTRNSQRTKKCMSTGGVYYKPWCLLFNCKKLAWEKTRDAYIDAKNIFSKKKRAFQKLKFWIVFTLSPFFKVTLYSQLKFLFFIRAKLGIGLAKNKTSEQKKKVRRRRRVPPILYLVKLFTFLSKFLPFSPSFSLQKLFLMFSTSTIFPRDILRKQFSQKSFSEKKKKKLFIFFFRFVFFEFVVFFFEFVFFFFIFFFLCSKPTRHLFLSILL